MTVTGIALITMKVADAEPEPDVETLIHDLEHTAHNEGREVYGRQATGRCHYSAWTRGETRQGRDSLVAFLADHEVDPERTAEILTAFDAAERPVALAHWWVAPTTGRGHA